MATINRNNYGYTKTYAELNQDSKQIKETNDCGVVAIAAVTGVSYNEAHDALAAQGRELGERVSNHQISEALKSLGYKVVPVLNDRFIADYPGVHKGLKNVTTHHPDRFADVWCDEQRYLFFTKSHVGAVVNGTNHDYTRGTAKRVEYIWAVIKKTAKVSEYLKSRGAE